MKTEIHSTNNMVLSNYVFIIFYAVQKSIFVVLRLSFIEKHVFRQMTEVFCCVFFIKFRCYFPIKVTLGQQPFPDSS